LSTLEFCDETRKKDQLVHDIVDINGGLGDHLHVEQLHTDLDWEIDFWNSHWHGVGSDDGVCS